MLFDATSVCRAAFCRSLGPGAGEALPPAALYAVLAFIAVPAVYYTVRML